MMIMITVDGKKTLMIAGFAVLFAFLAGILFLGGGRRNAGHLPMQAKGSIPRVDPGVLRGHRPKPPEESGRKPLMRGGRIVFLVRDMEARSPLQGARLYYGIKEEENWVDRLTKLGVSDSGGTLVLEWEPGKKPAWGRQNACLIVKKDGFLPKEIELEKLRVGSTKEVLLRRGCTLRFTFRDKYGAEVPGFLVALSKYQPSCSGYWIFKRRPEGIDPMNLSFLGKSDKNGVAVLAGVPPGFYRVVFFHPFWLPTGDWNQNYIRIRGDRNEEVEVGRAYVSGIKVKGDSVVSYSIHNPPIRGNSLNFQSARVLKQFLSDKYPGCFWSITPGDDDPSSDDYYGKKKAVFEFLLASAGEKNFHQAFVPLTRFKGPRVVEIRNDGNPRTLRCRLLFKTLGGEVFPPGSTFKISDAAGSSLRKRVFGIGGVSLRVKTGEFFSAPPGKYYILGSDPNLREAVSVDHFSIIGEPGGTCEIEIPMRKDIIPVDVVIEAPGGRLPDYGVLKYSEIATHAHDFSTGVRERKVRIHAGKVRFHVELQFFGFKPWSADLDGALLPANKPYVLRAELKYAHPTR